MNIIYLSDFNCIHSYIGLLRMKNAVAELDLDVDWEMKSFELESDGENTPSIERFASDTGLSVDDALKEIEKIAADEGLVINYTSMPIRSSRDAHRLVKYVQNRYPHISQELVLKIFESNFIENENIEDHKVLIDIAASFGLDENEISEMLEGESLEIEIALDMDEALSYGITTIPYYFIEYNGERLIIPGVFEKENIKTALNDLISGEIRNKSFV